MKQKSEVLEAISTWQAKGYKVIGPVKRDELVVFEVIRDPSEISFDHVITTNTLKDFMLPRCETILRFDLEKVETEPIFDESERIVIFASRPCDAAGLAILDGILIGEVVDSRYAKRRKQAVLVTVACSQSDDACFCTSMGYGPHDPTGSDVILLPSQGGYLVRIVSEKGREFASDVGLESDEGEPDPEPEVRRRVRTDGIKQWLDANFESPRWEQVSENCVSCGICSYLCPTCHCFDISDEAGIARGVRMRVWDCCSFAGFTKMASHQPRVGKYARYRQRVMHKFKYTVDNIGKVACVGDGRCIRSCPYGVDITEVLETLLAEG